LKSIIFGYILVFLVACTTNPTIIRTSHPEIDTRWVSVVKRHNEDITIKYASYWKTLVSTYITTPKEIHLDIINGSINEIPYVSDEKNWGQEDYWATPTVFFQVGGDCEDFAVAKYMLLRELNWEIDDLEIMIFYLPETKIYHAALIVKHEGKTLLLDQGYSSMTRWNEVIGKTYIPVRSFNENGNWRFKVK